ncbi:hypothetical protein [Chryseobacterium viscerum]|uniref:Uncharacterized protein n=1 Tax=Chryseobacterium viscerum TaxID=1037377 RepID=A0A316WCH5_9FLAO|nr:hypothetical protein [Chryseobacterium viscerum]PWN59007.1 hypothetical protein C1634_020555 [Chryseobacterium viscerum]
MYRFSKAINSITKFYLGNEGIVYQKIDGNLLLHDLILGNFIQQIEITLFNNVYINDWEGNFSVYDNKGNLVEQGINQAFFYVSKDYVGKQYIENNNIYESLIDKNNQLIFRVGFEKFNSENVLSKNHYFLLNKNKNIVCLNFKNEKEKWIFHISHKSQQGIEVYKFLGVFEKDLLVVLDDSSILRIDIETGEIKDNFKMVLFSNTENEITAQYNFIQFQNGTLIYYRFGQYAEYDLKLNKIIYEFDIKEKLEKEKLHDNIHSYIIEGDLLYFYISGFGSFSFPSIVVLNIKTKEIVWKHSLDNSDVYYKDFQKSETALYLLDSGNTLHIFEKD